MVISNIVILNLFILALVEQFEHFFDSEDSPIETYIEQIDKFRTVWCKYSTETEGKKMHCRNIANFLIDLGQPLGTYPFDNIWDAVKIVTNFKIKAY